MGKVHVNFPGLPLMLAVLVEQSYHSNNLVDLLPEMTSRLGYGRSLRGFSDVDSSSHVQTLKPTIKQIVGVACKHQSMTLGGRP